jgi:hypothetical protein
MFGYGFFLNTLFTLCPFEAKRGVFFIFGPEMYFQTGQVNFYPKMAKGGSLLVFYISNILVDKNTLCKCYFLTGLLVLFRVFM